MDDDLTTKITDLSDVPLEETPPAVPGTPDDERTPVSAFNSCI